MPQLEGDEEEAKQGGLNTLTSKKTINRTSALLLPIIAENNSYKLKNEIMQILYLLYHYCKITKIS